MLEHRNVSDPPPPPVWDLRDYRLWWRSEKKCRSNPPPPPPPPPLSSFFGTCATLDAGGAPKKSVGVPPPPAHQLFWDLRDFRGWRRSGKKTPSVVPPLFENPGSAPASSRLFWSLDWSKVHHVTKNNSTRKFVLRHSPPKPIVKSPDPIVKSPSQ